MIEIRIPKEIREYQEKIMLGMTTRQVVSIAIAGILAVALYFILNPILGLDITGFVILAISGPIAAWGFVKVGGMDVNEFAKMFVINTFFLPANRKYETENVFEQVADIISDAEYQSIKDDFEKVRIEEQKKLQKEEKKLRKMPNKAKTSTLQNAKPKPTKPDKPVKPIAKGKQTKEEKAAEKAYKKEHGWKKNEISSQPPEEIVGDDGNRPENT